MRRRRALRPGDANFSASEGWTEGRERPPANSVATLLHRAGAEQEAT